jgi:dihydrofolate reductase
MGRRTLESLPGKKGLPKRTNYVLSANQDFEAEGCIVVHSENELFDEIDRYPPDKVFLIGGASLYNRFYRYCRKLYVTRIEADLGADAFIVNFDEDPDFEIVSVSDPVTENGITFRFTVYEKRKK